MGSEGVVSEPEARRLTVDGEVFDVRPSRHDQGFDVDWVSGPDPDYGFSTGVSVSAAADGSTAEPPAMDDEQLVARIRQFLQMIDPTTGHIGRD